MFINNDPLVAANAPISQPIPSPMHYHQQPANADKRKPSDASEASAAAPFPTLPRASRNASLAKRALLPPPIFALGCKRGLNPTQAKRSEPSEASRATAGATAAVATADVITTTATTGVTATTTATTNATALSLALATALASASATATALALALATATVTASVDFTPKRCNIIEQITKNSLFILYALHPLSAPPHLDKLIQS
jgi:hypothetical protein